LHRDLSPSPLYPGCRRSQRELFEGTELSLSGLRRLADAFKKDLKRLVGLLPVEKCPVDWRFIRWEILNSYLVSDWERALKV
jgi:hypothetical protein